MNTTKVSLSFFVISTIFCTCLVVSNILAAKQFDIFGYSSTAGLILFPLTYIINDCIAEVWGYKKVRLLVWTAFIINFMMVIIFQLSVLLPPSPHWEYQEGYKAILGQTPRIAMASLIAFLVGSFLNAYVMSRMKLAHQGRKFGLRAIVSTLIGELADTFIFTTMGFLFVIPTPIVFQIICTETLFKTLFEILILPFTKWVVDYIKRSENVDQYDQNISYNILKIKDID